jgi:hypothetical protein
VECFDATTNACTLTPSCRLKHLFDDALAGYFKALDGATLADMTQAPCCPEAAKFNRQPAGRAACSGGRRPTPRRSHAPRPRRLKAEEERRLTMALTPSQATAHPAVGFEVPLEMLAACHGRVQHQCATLQRLLHPPSASRRRP